jgi:hypothetical protein
MLKDPNARGTAEENWKQDHKTTTVAVLQPHKKPTLPKKFK